MTNSTTLAAEDSSGLGGGGGGGGAEGPGRAGSSTLKPLQAYYDPSSAALASRTAQARSQAVELPEISSIEQETEPVNAHIDSTDVGDPRRGLTNDRGKERENSQSRDPFRHHPPMSLPSSVRLLPLQGRFRPILPSVKPPRQPLIAPSTSQHSRINSSRTVQEEEGGPRAAGTTALEEIVLSSDSDGSSVEIIESNPVRGSRESVPERNVPASTNLRSGKDTTMEVVYLSSDAEELEEEETPETKQGHMYSEELRAEHEQDETMQELPPTQAVSERRSSVLNDVTLLEEASRVPRWIEKATAETVRRPALALAARKYAPPPPGHVLDQIELSSDANDSDSSSSDIDKVAMPLPPPNPPGPLGKIDAFTRRKTARKSAPITFASFDASPEKADARIVSNASSSSPPQGRATAARKSVPTRVDERARRRTARKSAPIRYNRTMSEEEELSSSLSSSSSIVSPNASARDHPASARIPVLAVHESVPNVAQPSTQSGSSSPPEPATSQSLSIGDREFRQGSSSTSFRPIPSTSFHPRQQPPTVATGPDPPTKPLPGDPVQLQPSLSQSSGSLTLGSLDGRQGGGKGGFAVDVTDTDTDKETSKSRGVAPSEVRSLASRGEEKDLPRIAKKVGSSERLLRKRSSAGKVKAEKAREASSAPSQGSQSTGKRDKSGHLEKQARRAKTWLELLRVDDGVRVDIPIDWQAPPQPWLVQDPEDSIKDCIHDKQILFALDEILLDRSGTDHELTKATLSLQLESQNTTVGFPPTLNLACQTIPCDLVPQGTRSPSYPDTEQKKLSATLVPSPSHPLASQPLSLPFSPNLCRKAGSVSITLHLSLSIGSTFYETRYNLCSATSTTDPLVPRSGVSFLPFDRSDSKEGISVTIDVIPLRKQITSGDEARIELERRFARIQLDREGIWVPDAQAIRREGDEIREIRMVDLVQDGRYGYDFETKLPYRTGEVVRDWTHDTVENTAHWVRIKDDEIFRTTASPKEKLLARAHMRWGMLNPYPPSVFDQEITCWTHYAPLVHRFSLGDDLARLLRSRHVKHHLLTEVEVKKVLQACDAEKDKLERGERRTYDDSRREAMWLKREMV